MPSPRIVIGADFSEGSRRAIQAVSVLGRGAPVRIRLVHAFPTGKPRLAGAPLRRLNENIAVAELGEAAQLTRMAETLRKRGFDVDTIAVQGKPAATVLNQAKKARAGLIAVGTSGKRGMRNLFLGSVAQSILRDSPIPVLVTPARNRRGPRRAGPVLAAVDFDGTEGAVLAAAASLANDLGTKIQVLHAIRTPFIPSGYTDGAAVYTPDILAEDETSAGIELTKLAEPLRKLGTPVKTHITIGNAPTNTLAWAQQIGASAIVVGRRKPGRRLGSTSAAIVQGADRPVVVVPEGMSKRLTSFGFGPPS